MDPEQLESIIEKIRKCCQSEEAIIAVYLFGSSLIPQRKPINDIDIAILVELGSEKTFPVLAFAVLLERELNRRVDLTLLNRVGEVLKYQVRKYGRLIVERDPGKRKRFEMMSRKTFEDSLFFHNKNVRKQLYQK